jgi:hypothetical protein
MKCEVITAVRRARTKEECVGLEKPYNFIAVNAVIETIRGSEVAEFLLDKDQPMPERGHVYDMEVQAYPDSKTKRLTFRVHGLREPVAPRSVSAPPKAS